MSVFAGVLAGFLAVRFLMVVGRDLLDAVVLQRPNYRDHFLPTGAGVVLAVALLWIEGGRALLAALDVGDQTLDEARALMLVGVVGFCLLGFVDDVAGTAEARGFVGHGRALLRGRLTTGGVKLITGGTLALVVAGVHAGDDFGRFATDAALIALAANLANLFDRAPGRCVKVGVAAWVPLAVAAGTGPAGVAVAPVVGCALALLPDDLRERLMLGDAGANAFGAALGIGAVLALAADTRNLVCIALVVLNLAAEVISFSRVIDRVGPLRAFDRWGRTVPPASSA